MNYRLICSWNVNRFISETVRDRAKRSLFSTPPGAYMKPIETYFSRFWLMFFFCFLFWIISETVRDRAKRSLFSNPSAYIKPNMMYISRCWRILRHGVKLHQNRKLMFLNVKWSTDVKYRSHRPLRAIIRILQHNRKPLEIEQKWAYFRPSGLIWSL